MPCNWNQILVLQINLGVKKREKNYINDEKSKQEACRQDGGGPSHGERNLKGVKIATASPNTAPTTYPENLYPFSEKAAKARDSSSKTAEDFICPSAKIPIQKHAAFGVMLGLFISYKDVIRQITSADTQGCVFFNSGMLPSLVISRQPLATKITRCSRGLAFVTWQPVSAQ